MSFYNFKLKNSLVDGDNMVVCPHTECIGKECEHYNINEDENCNLKAEEKRILKAINAVIVCNTKNYLFN